MPNVFEDRQPFFVNVRWMDGLLETFYSVTDYRASASNLWLVFSDHRHRNIPLVSVRWWSSSVESHETVLRSQGSVGA